jgi:hypothetical protein
VHPILLPVFPGTPTFAEGSVTYTERRYNNRALTRAATTLDSTRRRAVAAEAGDHNDLAHAHRQQPFRFASAAAIWSRIDRRVVDPAA